MFTFPAGSPLHHSNGRKKRVDTPVLVDVQQSQFPRAFGAHPEIQMGVVGSDAYHFSR